MAIPPLPPLRVREEDSSPNVIPVFELVVSNNTLTDLGGGRVGLATGGASGSGTITAGSTNNLVIYTATPTTVDDTVPIGPRNTFVAVDSSSDAHHYKQLVAGANVTVAYNGTAVTISADTGASSGASTASKFVTYEADAGLSAERILVGGTNLFVTTNATQVLVSASGRMIAIPLTPATVQLDTGNAFWVAQSGINVDRSMIEFVDGGNGTATYWALMPPNIAPTPLWNLWFYHTANTNGGTATNVVVSASGILVAAGASIDGAYTALMAAVSLSTRAPGILQVSTGIATNFDSTLTLTADSLLYVEVSRIGGDAADTVTASWDLLTPVLRMNAL